MKKELSSIASKVKIVVKGKNVNRFLFKMYKKKISILNIEKKNSNEMNVCIYFKDYEKVVKLNTIYEIYIIEYGGMINSRKIMYKNRFVLFFVILSLIFIFILSRMIFNVEVITNDSKMRDILLYELELYDIKKYQFQKGYSEIQIIKDKILNKYKNDIEWIEIELVGTNYIVRYEPRIIHEKLSKIKPRHIVASQDAIIYSVISSKGQVIKNKNEYVKKGDIIVSGNIFLNEEVKNSVSAEGKVLGEVWYEVDVYYPYAYYEQVKTGKVKNVYVINFLNYRLELFNFTPFYDKIVNSNIIIKSDVLPFNLAKEKQFEVNTISSIKTEELIYLDAVSLAHSKIKNKLNKEGFIKTYKVIDKKLTDKGIELKIFFSVIEDITEYAEIGDVDNEKYNY